MVMRQVMHISAEQFFRLVAQHLGPCSIDERAAPLCIDPVDSFSGGFQQELHQPSHPLSFLLRPLALGDVAHDGHYIATIQLNVADINFNRENRAVFRDAGLRPF